MFSYIKGCSMMHVSKKTSMNAKALFVMLLAKGATLFKISFVVGSQMALFSAANCITPLMGVFCGATTAGAFFALRVMAHLLMYKTISLSVLAFYVPGLCASLYLATRSSAVRFFLPALCMALFIAHPVGNQAFAYSFFWFIPMALYFVPQRSFFWHALGSTFVAHAVGSVIWLYTVPMSASAWLGLIPVVAAERFVFALAMVGIYHVIQVVSEAAAQAQQQLSASGSAHTTHVYDAQ
jgi:hypothetical protein